MTFRSHACIFAVLLFFFSACADPPSKEMDQAQGAIDAAKAAGAEEFAPTELAAAIDALRRSEQAVAERDYRQALSLAIESRERAQNAAKTAGTARARARGELESQLAHAMALLSQARDLLRDPDVTRLRGRTLQEQRAVIDAANRSLQEARTALNNDDYARAKQAIEGVAPRIQAAIEAVNKAVAAQPVRRRR